MNENFWRLSSCSVKRVINQDENKATPLYFYYFLFIIIVQCISI